MTGRKKPATTTLGSADLLLELGTEELPAAYLPDLISQFKQEAEMLFGAQHLSFKQVESYGAPRRLVLIVRRLSAVQERPGEEIRGPSQQAAYTPEGKPTPALEGFLRSRGATLKQVKLVKGDKGAYVYVLKPPSKVASVSILPALLPQLVAKLRAPKTMRWDGSGLRFARPIRWLLALYGAQTVACTLGALKSEGATRVGRPAQLKRIAVRSVAQYLAALSKAKIILDQHARRQAIAGMIDQLSAKPGGHPAPEMTIHGLLDEVMHLVEHPVALEGEFDKKFLALPREVLLASMAKHQRVFAIDGKGSLLPRFIAILEGEPGDAALVRSVAERILNARLADGLLFWSEDRKRGLSAMARALTGVTFHEKLGTMAQKSERLQKLASALESAWSLKEHEATQLRKACELAKADLVSNLVREFPTLQGIVGGYLAQDAGESKEVAKAIAEQYLPMAGKAPQTLIGSGLALLEKWDTLVSYFAVGIEPTGDQDPFGLRRAAQGIVEIAWTANRPFPLDRLFEARAVIEPFAKGQPDAIAHRNKVAERVKRYVLERLYTFAWPAPVPPTDYIDAVLAGPCDDLVDVMHRIRSLQGLEGNPALMKAAKVVERTRNILKGAPAKQDGVDAGQLKEPIEQQLWQVYQAHESRVAKLTEQKAYAEATTLFGEAFYEPLHKFFDEVMVNVPEEGLRRNRLALMRAIHTLYTGRIADLSKLTVLQREEKVV